MKNQLKIIAVLALIVSVALNNWGSGSQNFFPQNIDFSAEQQIADTPEVGNSPIHQENEGLVERRTGNSRSVDQEKLPFEGLLFSNFFYYQDSYQLSSLKIGTEIDFFTAKDLSVLYHNLRI
jgi:hypothetical protein